MTSCEKPLLVKKLILNFIQLNLDLDGFTLTQEQFPHLLTTTKNKCFILSVF